MRIFVDQQCTLHSVIGPDNLDLRRLVAINDVRNVVDVNGVNDRVRRLREVEGVKVACFTLVLKEGTVTAVG